ncbi:MAG: PH domain-containing protein [Wohlfahrtiimonas sp.]
MLFSRKEEDLVRNEEILLQQYTHWWIFVVPGLLLLLGFYLWLKAVSKGSFSLYSLVVFDEPTAAVDSLKYQVQFYLNQGSSLLREHLPDSIYDFLSQTRLHPRKWLSQIVIVYALYRLIRATFTFLSTRITVTNMRVLVETGLLKPQVVEFPRMHIDAFHIKKGLFSRFLQVGTLIIQASGGLTARLPAIKLPQLLTNSVVENEHL